MSAFSERLSELRIQNGWSKTYVAELLGIRMGTYANYEYGTREPDFELVSRIANLYSVTTDYLIKEQPTDTPVDRLLSALNDKGISKSELARRSGFSRQVLNGYLNGRSHPSKENIEKMAKVLNVRPAWLAGYGGKYNIIDLSDIDNSHSVFTYKGKRISKTDIAFIKRILETGNYGGNK